MVLPSHTLCIKPIGDACNLQCLYCFNPHLQKRIILTAKNLKSALNKLRHRELRILISGGEPLLCSKSYMNELLQCIVDELGANVQIQIQTNGTLIDEEWLKLFSSYNSSKNINFSISLDPREGNLRLKESDRWDFLYSNILLCQEFFPYLGLISIVHRRNIQHFRYFIGMLKNDGFRYLTLNKVRDISFLRQGEHYGITEQQYVDFLKKTALWWIQTEFYKSIQIQPLMSIFSKDANRLCLYSADPKKCLDMSTLTNESLQQCCELYPNKSNGINSGCTECVAFDFCGGGCPADTHDSTFCDARLDLYKFVQRIIDENS